jgi:hemerythrin superfamily protein
MCQACGCRQIAIIDQLSREHEYVLTLVDKVRNPALGRADVREIVAEIQRVLRPHTRVEEDGLFPALSAYVPQRVEALTAEHRALETQLAQLAEYAVSGDAWLRPLLTAMRVLCDHIASEREALFPVAMACLDPTQAAEIEQVRSMVGDPLKP